MWVILDVTKFARKQRKWKYNQTRPRWPGPISIWMNFYHYVEPFWPIQSYLELFGPNLVLSGLVWYGLVSYFTYWSHFELCEATWDTLEHLKEEQKICWKKNKNNYCIILLRNKNFVIKKRWHFFVTNVLSKDQFVKKKSQD